MIQPFTRLYAIDKEVAMSIIHPGKLQVLTHEFMWLVLLKGYYRQYVQSFNLTGDEHVLDFGCGPGSTARFIAQAVSRGKGSLICLDLSPEWISRARKHLADFANVSFHAGDIREWTKKDSFFDVVTMHYIFHEIPPGEQDEVLQALVQKMKPGARMFIREPIKESHGIPPEKIRSLFLNQGFKELRSDISKRTFMGEMYTGVWLK